MLKFPLLKILKILKSEKTRSKTYLRFDHTWGGGSETVAERWINSNSEHRIIQVRNSNDSSYTIENIKGTERYIIKCEIALLEWILKFIRIDEIVVGQFANYNIGRMTDLISQIKQKRRCKVIYYLQDFYSLCPTYSLLNYKNEYCGGGGDQCFDCYPKVASNEELNDFKTIDDWREQWRLLFNIVDEIRVFSNYSESFLRKFFIDYKGDIIQEKMQVEALEEVTLRTHTHGPYNVAVIGFISVPKGLEVLSGIDKILGTEDTRLVFHIYGGSTEPLGNFINHGRYTARDLAEYFIRDSIDIVLIPSICAETFCLAAEEIMQMNVPVSCFNVGAHAERINNYKKGLVIRTIDPQVTCDEILNYLK